MSDYRFDLIDAEHDRPLDEESRQQLQQRPSANRDVSLRGTAFKYVPDEQLRTTINTAIAISQPLLLTGEAGTGKTQVAYYVGHRLNLPVFHFQARSTSTARDLLYDFDTVRYFHDAHVGALDRNKSPAEVKRNYITPREMWEAFQKSEETGLPSILLIDEIDKAPRDFPNDLLHEISEMSFRINEIPELETAVSCPAGLRPLVFVTSNDERRLPDAFLRRCVSHHIELSPDLLTRVAESHRDEYPDLSPDFIQLAITRFLEIRSRKLEKPPASGELLAWLQIMSLSLGKSPNALNADLQDIPYLSTLLKSPDSVGDLRR